jgi:hypothetical protein
MKRLLLLFVLFVPTVASATTCGFVAGKTLCRGDRNCDCEVTIDEIQYMIAAAQYSGDFCSSANPACDSPDGINLSHGDSDCNWQISIAEITQAINNANNGCISPCYSGLNYPINIGGTLCTNSIFRANHCGGIHCSHAQCGACP